MDITLVRSNNQRKNPRLVIFKIEGRAGSVQFFRPLFGEAVPEQLTLTGEFAAPKRRETPEERKARLKALPKPTAQEKVAKMEKQLAKMKARLAAGNIDKFIQPEDGIKVISHDAPAPTPTPAPTPAPTAAQPKRAAKGKK